MRKNSLKSGHWIAIITLIFGAQITWFNAYAAFPGAIGLNLLQATTTNLNGSGIRVAQVEAGESSTNNWEVNPAAVGRPVSLFTYSSILGTSTNFPNAVGAESSHADSVGSEFYGASAVASNVARVDNFEANHFYFDIVAVPLPTNINVRVVNQSFLWGTVLTSVQQTIDSDYDDYAAKFNVLFVDGAGNRDPIEVTPPATAYNSITVGAFLGGINYSSEGPTPDNGRCKPDITAPHNATSFAAPQVAGGAAMLMQAGIRGDGGSDTNSAVDIRTIKALLLNGAIKLTGWTNGPSSPLDARYGAGMYNVFNSYKQLAGGQQINCFTNNVNANSSHPPSGITNTIPALSGWNFSTNYSSSSLDGIHHYLFNVTNALNDAPFCATATLVWNRQSGLAAINDLNLFLYNAANSNLVAWSTSRVDNVEHIFVRQLPPGRYDLQVLKRGGNSSIKITTAEPYALAFEFFNVSLAVAKSGTNVVLTWPLYPAGFQLEAATNLIAPVWVTNNLAPTVTNNLNRVTRDASSGNEFFRLRRP